MLDERQFDDLREIFPTLVLFGDPAQLAPVGQSGEMVFDKLDTARRLVLSRIHRQAEDNPILDLAHALGDDATVRSVVVDGGQGYWIEGSPHQLFFEVGDDIQVDTLRLATNTLLWQRNGHVYRIEADIDLDAALRIAASVP